VNLTKVTSFIVFVFCLNCAPSTYAALITYHNHTLNTETGIVSGEGLEWLRWDTAIGMSVEQAQNSLATGRINGIDYGTGWRVATNRDVATLFNAFFPQMLWDDNEFTWQSVDIPYVEGDNLSSVTQQFFTLFGFTYSDIERGGNPLDFRYFSSVIFGEDGNNDKTYNSASVMDDYLGLWYYDRDTGEPVYRENEGSVRIRDEWYYFEEYSGNAGIAFVRDISPVSVPTPAPVAVILMTLLLLKSRKWFWVK